MLASGSVWAKTGEPVGPVVETDAAQSGAVPAAADPWLDRTHRWIYGTAWRSARRIDGLFGPVREQWRYEQTSGSIAPALLWDEFRGWKPKLRFRVNLPLPRMDERFAAFIGRVNRDEYVTERAEPSGAFPRQYGPIEDDQTLFGISYREPWRQGWRFTADGGVRVRTPPDPYLKMGYVYERGTPHRLLFTARETLFWQNSENLGFTSRVDLARFVGERWLLRSALSGTVSQETEGVRGFGTLMALRPLPGRRAVALEIGLNGETELPVPLHEYWLKAAWRQSVVREWLVLELRTSISYPKDFPGQPRAPSWGAGVGFEMYFGTDEFSAQPVTF